MKTSFSISQLLLAIILISTLSHSYAESADTSLEDCPQRHYIFSWNMLGNCLPSPRGGSSRGAPVTLATEASQQWQALQEPGLSPFERDRRAILAMVGGYRASFEFLETIGYPADYQLSRPYQSWGTEYIYTVADSRDFISLQHIMVMFFQQDDGTLSGPIVMKHWRQDWQYQDREIHEYSGDNSWQRRKLSKREVQGSWSQSVYQVDDSPRYAAIGRWQHNGSFSAWQSETTWRPLPRREHSVRDDYQVLEGTNRHVILPTGWVHEEENLKRVLAADAGGKANTANEKIQPHYLAKELGNNRYQLLSDFDWSAGDQYWQSTGPFWKIVRQEWQQLIKQHHRFALRKQVDSVPLFMALFQLAEQFSNRQLANPEESIATVLNDYLQP